jgi:hypothetical protein
LKDATPVFLQFLENAQRCRQFFVRCRHLRLSPSGEYKLLEPFYCKYMLTRDYK